MGSLGQSRQNSPFSTQRPQPGNFQHGVVIVFVIVTVVIIVTIVFVVIIVLVTVAIAVIVIDTRQCLR